MRALASAAGVVLGIALLGAADRPALFTAAQAKNGEAVYNRACASCHGRTLTGGSAPPLTGAGFARSWGDPRITLDDLFFVMRTTMPPRQANALTADERVDTFAYILSANGYPPGSAALATNTPALRTLAVDVVRATTAPTRTAPPEFVAGAAGANAPATGPDQATLNAAAASTDWLIHNHDYSGTRYSPLDQITAANASRLVPACIFQVGEPDNFPVSLPTRS